MPPNKKNRKGPRRSSRKKDEDDHPSAPADQKKDSRHALVLEIIYKDLPPNKRQNLTAKQIVQLIGDCQVRVKRCPDIIDISSDNEQLIGIAIEKKPSNQYTCKRCNDTYSWHPNEDYLCHKPEMKRNPSGSGGPSLPKLQFKMHCNCSQI